MFLIGLAVYILGYLGVLLGNIIKAAISRQREFLADASSVQFTRNPAGLAGALKKIGGLAEGSRIRDAHAHEISHMFFGDAFAGSFFNLFATHPPLEARIRLLDPNFDGSFTPTEPLQEEAAYKPDAQASGATRPLAGASGLYAGARPPRSPACAGHGAAGAAAAGPTDEHGRRPHSQPSRQPAGGTPGTRRPPRRRPAGRGAPGGARAVFGAGGHLRAAAQPRGPADAATAMANAPAADRAAAGEDRGAAFQA